MNESERDSEVSPSSVPWGISFLSGKTPLGARMLLQGRPLDGEQALGYFQQGHSVVTLIINTIVTGCNREDDEPSTGNGTMMTKEYNPAPAAAWGGWVLL